MKGKNLVKTPGELYAPTTGGVVVSADGVKDYRQNKMQETINKEVIDTANEAKEIANRTAGSAASIANIVETLREHSEENLADVLNLEDRTENLERDTESLKDQLKNYSIVEISEADMEALLESEDEIPDENTLYLVPEEEET